MQVMPARMHHGGLTLSGAGSPPTRVACAAMATELPGPASARTSLLRPAGRGAPPSPSSAVQ